MFQFNPPNKKKKHPDDMGDVTSEILDILLAAPWYHWPEQNKYIYTLIIFLYFNKK